MVCYSMTESRPCRMSESPDPDLRDVFRLLYQDDHDDDWSFNIGVWKIDLSSYGQS